MNGTDKKRITATVGLVFSIGGLILSGLLVCKHGFPDLCASSWGCSTTDGVDGCAQLAQSHYSKILGIPIAIPGFFFYALLVAMFWRIRQGAHSSMTLVLATLVVFGAVFDAFLGYINFGVMVVPCKLCAYSYIAMAGALVAGIMLYRSESDKEISMKAFTANLKQFLLPGGAAAGLTMALFLVLFVASSVSSERKEQAGGLLPEASVPSTLAEFRQLNKVDMKNDGLTLMEGKDSGYIVVHDFADFRCPHCYHAAEILKQLNQRWPGRVRVYYRQFPLDGNCNPAVGRKQDGAFSCNGTQA
ncbi:MAG: DsbA family protein, partial [Spirochaetia bacterium]|nr:DsbA family protein [Spirochaetia bacterium]